jgi:hypothetical protein
MNPIRHIRRLAAALAGLAGALLALGAAGPATEVRPRQRLWDAIDTAAGGLPAAITTEPAVLRGKPGQVLTDWPAHGPVEHPREPAGQRWGRQAARFSRPP